MNDDDPWRPLGLALLDYHRGQRDARFCVRSSLWEVEMTAAEDYYRPDHRRLSEIERRALRLCRGHVLDLGAGAGRHALELQRRGLEVTALDISEEAVRVMQERGVKDARRGDLFFFRGNYDTILLLMHGIGVVGDLDGLQRFLRHASQLLKPGGQIVADSADLSAEVLGSEAPSPAERTADGHVGEVLFQLSYGEVVGRWYPWFFADAATLESTARQAGFGFELLAYGERGGFLARFDLI